MPPKKKAMQFTPKVISVIANQEFQWKGVVFKPWIFVGQHSFRHKEISPGKTQFIHEEQFSGILHVPVMKLIEKSTREGFVMMNQALKSYVEGTGSRKSDSICREKACQVR